MCLQHAPLSTSERLSDSMHAVLACVNSAAQRVKMRRCIVEGSVPSGGARRGCAGPSGQRYSVTTNQESDNLFVSLHAPSPALQMEAQMQFSLMNPVQRKWAFAAPQTHPA